MVHHPFLQISLFTLGVSEVLGRHPGGFWCASPHGLAVGLQLQRISKAGFGLDAAGLGKPQVLSQRAWCHLPTSRSSSSGISACFCVSCPTQQALHPNLGKKRGKGIIQTCSFTKFICLVPHDGIALSNNVLDLVLPDQIKAIRPAHQTDSDPAI